MKKIILIIILAFSMSLSSCNINKKETITNSSSGNLNIVTTDIEPNIPFTDDLLPVEDYSSVRTAGITHIVLHFMSSVVNNPNDPYNIEYVRQIFLDSELSIHYLVDREGKIYRYIPENRTAWHAGKGEWNNDDNYTNKMNSQSIGIEILGIGTYEEMQGFISKDQYDNISSSFIGFTPAQYDAINALLIDICERNPKIISDRNHIIGHYEYSVQKTDPGKLFDWSKLTCLNK